MKISKNKYSSLSKALLKKLFDIDIDDIARYIQKLQVQCKQLQSSANAISNENDELKKQLEKSKSEYQELDAKCITLEEQLSEEKAFRVELQQQIGTLQKDNTSVEQNIATLRTENDELHKKLDDQIKLNQQTGQGKDNVNTEEGNPKTESSSDIQSNVIHNLHGRRRKAPSYSPEESEIDDTNEEYLEELEKAKKLLIPEVYDTQEETIIDSKEFFLNTSDEDISKWRRIIDEAKLNGTPRLICPACGQPVNLCGHKFSSGRICYFAHFKSDIECEFKSSSRKLSDEQVEQLYETHKYGNRHSDMQIKLAQALKGTRSQEIGVSNVKINGFLTGLAAESSFRCPDVSAQFKGQTIAFELQLSTTFLQSIVKKDSYYKENNIYSLWIFNFDGLNESDELSKLVSRDIFHANHNNVFVFDKAAQRRSEESGELILRCKWIDESNKWCGNEYIGLNSLIFDIKNKNLFYHPQTDDVEIDSTDSKTSTPENVECSMDDSTSDETLNGPTVVAENENVYYFQQGLKHICTLDMPPYKEKYTTFVIPDLVTEIWRSAFEGCTGMIFVKLPNSIKEICAGAFFGCIGLTTIKIPNSVTKIGISAFAGCTGLKSIEIPNSVIEIGDRAFYGCTGLTSIDIPGRVKRIGFCAFEGCDNLINPIYNSTCLVYVSRSECGIHKIKDGTIVIGKEAFQNCTGITSIEIPNSVTEIGWSAFEGCTGLKSINIPESVTDIENYAFQNCTGLTSIEIPNSVKRIGYSYDLFAGRVAVDCNEVFQCCSGIETIKVDPSNTEYDSRNDCNAIIKTDANKLLVGCKNTIIPNSVTEIGMYAFMGCTSLKSINIPESVTEIGSFAFAGCTGLTCIELPKSVTSLIDKYSIASDINYVSAFQWCINLKTICVDKHNPKYDSRENCNAIIEKKTNRLIVGCMNTIIPSSVTEIGEAAFYGCTRLTSIEIPNGVTEISRSAFSGCSKLTSVEIENGVKKIGDCAFKDCSGLVSITIPKSVIELGDYIFDGCDNLKTIKMPRGTKLYSSCWITYQENDCIKIQYY